jgi:flagellar biosynthetic protein FlhB
MTRQEVRLEARQADVAPEVRGQIRRRQLESARRRMMADVPTADVVVTNPTHFAVALRYDGSTPAPVVVARGADLVAAAIRSIAREHGVPVLSSPPLARALYHDVELGEMVPDRFFAAVAEVLAFVYRTSGRRRRVG